MSIVRIGIIVAVVIAVLPADKQQQARLYDRAATAVHWTATFCDRNGPTCTQAGDLWSAFATKAKFGAQMAYELVLKYSKRVPSRLRIWSRRGAADPSEPASDVAIAGAATGGTPRSRPSARDVPSLGLQAEACCAWPQRTPMC
jgi:hypothetical protein